MEDQGLELLQLLQGLVPGEPSQPGPVEPAVGDREAYREQAAVAVEQEIEIHFVDQIVGACTSKLAPHGIGVVPAREGDELEV